MGIRRTASGLAAAEAEGKGKGKGKARNQAPTAVTVRNRSEHRERSWRRHRRTSVTTGPLTKKIPAPGAATRARELDHLPDEGPLYEICP
jgi:hypothetical protein